MAVKKRALPEQHTDSGADVRLVCWLTGGEVSLAPLAAVGVCAGDGKEYLLSERRR